MGKFIKKSGSILLVMVIALSGSAFWFGGDEDDQKEPMLRIKDAVARAAKASKAAAIQEAMAFNAIKNAIANRKDAEELWLAAIRTGEKKGAAKSNLKDAAHAAEEALLELETLVELTTKAQSAGKKARTLLKDAMEEESDKDLKRIAGKVESLAEMAGHAVEKAQEISEELKEQWLIPVVSTTTSTTTTTTTTTQPPGVTPAGRM